MKTIITKIATIFIILLSINFKVTGQSDQGLNAGQLRGPEFIDGLSNRTFDIEPVIRPYGGTGDYTYRWMICRDYMKHDGWELLSESKTLRNTTTFEVEDIQLVYYRLYVDDGINTTYSPAVKVTNIDIINPGVIKPEKLYTDKNATFKIESDVVMQPVYFLNDPVDYWWEYSYGGRWEKITNSKSWDLHLSRIERSTKYRRAIKYTTREKIFYSNEVKVIIDYKEIDGNIQSVETTYYKSDGEKLNESIRLVDFYDSFGFITQTINVQASPLGYDIVNFGERDKMARDSVIYLPYVSSTYNGSYRDNPYAEQKKWYNINFPADNDVRYTYSTMNYDSSPLSLVTNTGAPGETNQKHPVLYEYGLNKVEDELKELRIDSDNESLFFSHRLSEGVLSYTMTKLKDGGPDAVKKYEWKNSDGVTLATETRLPNDERRITYYVYDDYGRLRYIIPPIQERLITTTGVYPLSTLTDYCYYTEYNSTGLPHKQYIPGAGCIYKVFDKRGRVVFESHPNIHLINTPYNDWVFTKYDELDRPIIKGIARLHATFENLNEVIGEQVNYGEIIGGPMHGYTNQSVPIFHESLAYDVVYYDGYEWLTDPRFDFSPEDALVDKYCNDIVGLVTGKKTKVLKEEDERLSEEYLTTVLYYDEKYRPIQSISELYPNGIEIVSNCHDFIGNVLQTRVKQIFPHNNQTVEYSKWFEYDTHGRLMSIEQEINGDVRGRVTIASYEYDELGQLQRKNLHNDSETIEYKYRISGIKQSEESSKFSYYLGMDRSLIPGEDGYVDGKVAQLQWKHAGDPQHKAYHYSYEPAGQLIDSKLYEQIDSEWNSSDKRRESAEYDINGNPIYIIRYGEVGGDSTRYDFQYHGNLLTRVTETTQGVSTSADFEYDESGNLLYDGSTGLRFAYNEIGLPCKISSTGDHSYVKYVYSADGSKLASIVDGNVTLYRNNFVYASSENNSQTNQLLYIGHQEGITACSGNTYEYRYFLTDHLGSTRTVIAPAEQGQALQTTNYYPFGLPWETNDLHINKFLFSGKEYQDASIGNFGYLGLYDFHARFYNPRYGRWFNQDPALQTTNPYLYCFNSPGMYTDPNGEWAWIWLGFLRGAVSYGIGVAKGHYQFDWKDFGFSVLTSGGTAGVAHSIDATIGSGQGVYQNVGPGYTTTGVYVGSGRSASVNWDVVSAEYVNSYRERKALERQKEIFKLQYSVQRQMDYYDRLGIQYEPIYDINELRWHTLGLSTSAIIPTAGRGLSSIRFGSGSKIESILSRSNFQEYTRQGREIRSITSSNPDAIFKSLTKGGKLHSTASNQTTYILKDGSYVTYYPSTRTQYPSIQINQNGIVTKIRILPHNHTRLIL